MTAAFADRSAIFVAALLSSAVPLLAQTDTMAAARAALGSIPLFASHDVLSITIEAPLETIFKERSQYGPSRVAPTRIACARDSSEKRHDSGA